MRFIWNSQAKNDTQVCILFFLKKKFKKIALKVMLMKNLKRKARSFFYTSELFSTSNDNVRSMIDTRHWHFNYVYHLHLCYSRLNLPAYCSVFYTLSIKFFRLLCEMMIKKFECVAQSKYFFLPANQKNKREEVDESERCVCTLLKFMII